MTARAIMSAFPVMKGSGAGRLSGRWRNATAVALLVSFVCFLSVTRAAGQSPTATLRGVVRDPSEAVIARATVTVTSLDTLRALAALTQPDGSFRWIALPPGRYRVVVAHQGFMPAARDIELAIDEDRVLTVVLAIARPAESMDVVAAEAPLVEPSRTSLGRTITSRELDQMPIPSGTARNFAALATLAPGIVTDVATTTSGIATAGQLGGSNTFLLDGVSIDAPANGGVTGAPPLEAVREFKVISNHFSAEFGNASGALVTVLTRSGTNAASGRLYGLQQSGAWNAASPTAKQTGASDSGLQQEVFGGYWSGPLVRSRVFLFGTAEHLIRDTSYVNTSPVIRDFRPNDPLTIPVHSRQPRAFVRSDVHLTSSNILTLRYHASRVTNSQAVREPTSALERGSSVVTPVHDVALVDTHIIGSRAVSEARVHWSRQRQTRSVEGYCDACATLNYPGIRLGKQPNSPLASVSGRLDLVETLTWPVDDFLGRHAFKSGINVSLARGDGSAPTNLTGTYQFSKDIPFDKDNPASYPDSFRQNFGNPDVRVHETIVSVFFQDEWQPVESVTLNVGIRWDRTQWPAPHRRRDDVAPRLGVSIDPWKRGTTALRAGVGRYYDDTALQIARDAEVGFDTLTILRPGFQGDLAHFDPRGFNPNRSGPPVEQHSRNVFAPIHTPYTDQASIGVQRQLARQIGITVDLVRAVGHRLPIARDLNYRDPVTLVRPDPDTRIRQVIATETRAHSWYTGVQVGLQRRFANRHTYAIAYTWSSPESDTDGARAFPQDQNDLAADRGPTLNDVRHQLVVSGTLDAPFGFRVTSVVSAHSALPYNVITGTDDNRNLVLPNNDRPPGVGRNSARGAAFFQTDLRISRVLGGSRRRVELLAEVFNVTNRANWTDYNGNMLASGFGTPGGAGPPRQIQLGVRFQF
jgi:Carboxypeptidase regulatory-like domain/TonB dependent receptor-like, beta-barrel